MKEITSKKTGKVQIITNDTWDKVPFKNRFTVRDITKVVKSLPPEIVKNKPKRKLDGQKN